MIRSITIRNHLGNSVKLELTRPDLSGFIIKSIDGLGPTKANINTTDIATNDGSIFNSSRLDKRNITLNLEFFQTDTESIEDIRQKTYKYFPINQQVYMTVETDNHTLETEGYQNGNPFFVLYKDIDQYKNETVPEEDMYIQDGTKFIHLLDSDFFEPTGDPEDDYAFMEENCFVKVDEETEYFDPDIPNVYYMRLTDYYNKTEYKIDDSLHYVKDPNGNYIPITDLIDPNNCYVFINGGYYLVADQ